MAADISTLSDAELEAHRSALPPPISSLTDDELAQHSAALPAEPSTLGYIGSRFLGGLLESGKWLGVASGADARNPEQIKDMMDLPSGQETANQWIYGRPQVAPPSGAVSGPAARYGGAVSSAFGTNPVMGAVMPGITATGALGGEGGSDLNKATGSHLYDWLARLLGGTAAGGMYGVAKNIVTPSPARSVLGDIPSNKETERALSQQGRFGETQMGAYQKPAQAAADAIAPEVSPTQIGQTMLDKTKAWLKGQKDEAHSNFNAIESRFPKGSRADMPATMDFLTEPNEGPPLPSLASDLQTQLNKTGGSLPYADMKTWRSDIGELVDTNPRLRPLYKAMTDDMEGALHARGGDEAVGAFRAANSAYRESKDFIEERLGRLGNSSLPPERLAGIVRNPAAHATELGDLLNNGVIDRGDINSIARAWLEKAGRNSDGLRDPIALTKAATQLRQQSPEAEALMFPIGTKARAQYDDLLDKASTLAMVNSPFAKANAPKPGIIRKMLPVAAGLGAEAAGVPGGEMAAGYLMGHSQHGTVNPLYRLPSSGVPMGLLQSPVTQAAGVSLLNPPQPRRP